MIKVSKAPTHPHFFSSPGKRSDNRATMSPINGVANKEIRNVHPKPILRRAPKKPTNTAKSVLVNKPNIINAKYIT